MNEFEELLNSVGDVKVGDVVSGEILTVEDGQATVAIVGTGVEGVLTLRELTRKAFTDLEGKEGEVVIVKVLKDVKGGLSVDLNGVRGFIPASMIDTYFVRDTKKFVGEEFEAKIIEVNAADKRFILSRRAVIEEESKAQRAEAFANLHEGDIVEGTVARTTDFGAFINLGGVDGLVHVTELAHGRVKKPSDVVTVGETVQVKVLKVDEEAGRVSLSLKATQPGPWDEIEEKAPVGTVLDGTVKRITDFGAFVEIFPGVEGLVHISQISWERVENAKDVLTVGQAVQVKVLDVKPAEERISLSIKALAEAPARKERTNDSAGSSAAQGGQRRDAKPRAPRRNTKPEYTLPETQEGFSLADFLGEDFDINNF